MSIEKKITITIDAKDAKRQLSAMNKLIKDNAKEAKRAAAESAALSKKADRTAKQAEKTAKDKAASIRYMAKQEFAAYDMVEKKTRTLGLAQISAYKMVEEAAKDKAATVRMLGLSEIAAYEMVEKQVRKLGLAEIAAYEMVESAAKQKAATVRTLGLAEIAAYEYVEKQVRKLGLAEVAAYQMVETAARKKAATVRKIGLAEISAYEYVEKKARKRGLAEVEAYKMVETAAKQKAVTVRKIGLAEIAAYEEAKKRANPQTSAPSGVGRAVGAVSLAVTARQLVNLIDGYAEFTNRLRTATKSEEELLDVQGKIVEIAKKTRTGLEENGLLYLRLAKATENAGTSSKDLLRITETVNKAVQIGGSSAQEAAGAIRQFTQIISAGFSSGFSQEINSLAEQTPGLFDVIVDGLRETSQEFRDLEDSGMSGIKILKEFSEKGIGDLDMLLKAVASQGDAVDKQFLSIRPTITKSITVFRTSLQAYIGTADQATGASSKVANAIETLADNMHLIAAGAIIAGGAISGMLLRGLISSTAAMIAASGAAKTLLFTINPFLAIAGAMAGVILAFKSIQVPTVDATEKMSKFAKAAQFAKEELNKLSQLDLKNSIGSFRDEISNIDDNIAALYSSKEIVALQKRKKTAQDILDVSENEGVRLTARSKARQESIIKSAENEIALLMALAKDEEKELLNQKQKLQSQLNALDSEANNRTATGKAMLANERIVALELEYSKELQITKKYKKIIEDAKNDISLSGDPAFEARARETISIIESQYKAELDAIDEVIIAKIEQQKIFDRIDKENAEADALFLANKRHARENSSKEELDAITQFYASIQGLRTDDNILSGMAMLEQKDKRGEVGKEERDGIIKYDEETAKKKLEVNQLMSGALVEMMSSQSEELFNIGKMGSMASAIVNTYEGMSKAMAQGGIFGFAAATAVGLAGASQIANIGSTKFGDKGMKGTAMADPVAAQSSITNNTQSSQTTINITGGVGFTTDDLTALFDSDAVIINRDSAQGRALR